MAEATLGQKSNKALELLWDEIDNLVILTDFRKSLLRRRKQGTGGHMKMILKFGALLPKYELDVHS